MLRPDIPARTASLVIGTAFLAIAAAYLTGVGPAGAQTAHIVGQPRVVDGDTLEFAEGQVDLDGIDAPETEQTCTRDGTSWACGLDARWALVNRIGRNWVTCVPQESSGAAPVRALCYLAGVGQLDVGEWLVAEGWALALEGPGDRYQAAQAAAQSAGKGLWQGAFVAPWDWRSQ
jgi:endonuclease YncB( thermonuclease family)